MPQNKTDPPCKKDQICAVEITGLNHRGEGVGKVSAFTLFIPGALPTEKTRVKITSIHKTYGMAELVSIEKASEQRVAPTCPYFSRCGGCQLQHMAYSEQLRWKQLKVAETLRRIAAIETLVLPTLGMSSPWQYRNKAQIHFGLENGNLKAGFFEKESHNIIHITDCPVQHRLNNKMSEQILKTLQNELDSGLILPFTEVQLRSSSADDKCLISFLNITGNSQLTRLKRIAKALYSEHKDSLSGLVMQVSGKKGKHLETLAGQPYIEEEIKPFRYRISPQSFFQVNPQQAGVLYNQAAELAGNPATAFDLFCGTGNFALYLSQVADQVVGVDSELSAINDARANAESNKVNNLTFINARAEDIPALVLEGKTPKTVFLNPPRRGCSAKILAAVSKSGPERIVYISCNPATLARDLGILKTSGFLTRQVQPIDMFPHTSHVESVALLSRVEK